MRKELTRNEMLALWKRRHFLEPLRADCMVARTDGVDLDAMCADSMRQWYVRLLAEGSTDLLAPEDLSLKVTVRRTPQGSVLLPLPEEVVRVVAVKLNGWEREAVPVSATSAVASRQANRFARGGKANPVAVLRPDRTLELFSPDSTTALPAVETFLAVTDPGEDKYVFDERALETIENQL